MKAKAPCLACLQCQRGAVSNKHRPAVIEQPQQEDGVEAAGEAEQGQGPGGQRLGPDVQCHHHCLGG